MHAVVVGGIVGLASAHALAERDVRVTVCEKGSLGGGSTGRSAGGIRAQFSTPVNVDLYLASLEVWNGFEERFGIDIAHRRVSLSRPRRGYRRATARERYHAERAGRSERVPHAGGGGRTLCWPPPRAVRRRELLAGGRHGFMHAPATGKLVAELVCDGEASLVDAEPLRSDRFGSEVTTERNVV